MTSRFLDILRWIRRAHMALHTRIRGTLAPEPEFQHDGDILIFVHIPKTAGTTFNGILRHIFGDRMCIDYQDRLHRWLHPDRIPGYCRCISGHFPRGKYAATFPDATYITWLREPVERLMSSCHQHVRRKNPHDPVNVRIHEQGLSAEQAALLPELHNQQQQFFGGFDTTDFAFVGIVEEFEKSMECFQRLFGLERLPTIPRRNTNPHRTKASYDIPTNLRKRLMQLNEADYALYDKARAELDALHVRLRG